MPMGEGSHAELRDLATTLRELAWTIHRTAPERAGVGPIPTTELALLKQVLDTPGATIGELSHALGLRQPNTSAAVGVLVRRGFVTRETSADDRRVTRIVATDLGAAEHAAIAQAWIEPLERALADLGAHEVATLVRAGDALRSLHDRMRPAGD